MTTNFGQSAGQLRSSTRGVENLIRQQLFIPAGCGQGLHNLQRALRQVDNVLVVFRIGGQSQRILNDANDRLRILFAVTAHHLTHAAIAQGHEAADWKEAHHLQEGTHDFRIDIA